MEKLKIGINGFGRIGRLVFRVAMKQADIQVVGINDLLDVDHLAYLLNYDSVHGNYPGVIETLDGDLIVDGKRIRVTAERNPEDLKWDAVNVDVVAECTGLFKTQDTAKKHLKAGAKKVVVSAPSSDIPMVVMGINHTSLSPSTQIVSNASCTTNCLAPMVKVLEDQFGITEALMTTVHATTSTQFTVDSPSNKNYRLGRSALNNIIPSSTGAAKAVGKIIPELNGKITGMAFRVPTANVSVVDLTVKLNQATSYEAIKTAFKNAAFGSLSGILDYSEAEVVSQDFVGNAHVCTFDANAGIELNPTFFKIVGWYDNEFGYSSKLVDLARHINEL